MKRRDRLAALRAELRDVCEIDRRHVGYELTWDDGTADRVRTAHEARALAAQVRRDGYSPARARAALGTDRPLTADDRRLIEDVTRPEAGR